MKSKPGSVPFQHSRAVAAASAFFVFAAGGALAAPKADLVLTNARIYTVDDKQPWAEAVAISGGKIVAVGPKASVDSYVKRGAKVVDLGGRLVLPAFGDAHVHPVFGGMAFTRCSLHAGRSVEDYQKIIKGCVAAAPGTGTIHGVGWEDSLFPPNGVPRKEVLDAISTDRPLVFGSVGGHTFWVNSKALALANITRDTPNPPNGEINRDPTTGEPVGSLQESAMDLVAPLVPKPSSEDMQASILYVGKLFNSLGLTGWHDAGIDLSAEGGSEMLAAYKALHDKGALPAHITLAFKWENERGLEQVDTIIAASRAAAQQGLRAKTVKFYVDGVIPQQTAAMIAPYEGTTSRGVLQIDPEVLKTAVTRLGAAGFQPYVHAIGDGAVRVGLDAFEAAIKANGSLDRPMITHLNVIDPQDQPRFGKLGVIAQFQPTWSSNYPYMDLTKQAIGAKRSEYIYPTGSILRGGGIIAFGADWPVATANPLEGLQVAVTRVNYEATETPPLLADEAITLPQAVKAHTLNAALANGTADITGSVQTGKSADLVVLDQDIFKIDPMQIGKTKVLLTLFKGAPVHGELGGLAPARP
ncbi:amidohydrolase [Caulobacter segnis]|uniref:amidohydrolase n=1 Tax=Caulobacter segnis TaxID=88688 RepID=UPI00240F2F02|nr:amidohydrolase [Caulobacter segnis]MDG2523019.1 amidohydrolase [Caulobacter segnis]